MDRLGRNYEAVSDNIRVFVRRGAVIKPVINGILTVLQKAPWRRPSGTALIDFMAALSQAQAEAIKKAQRVGIAHAKVGMEKVYLGLKPNYMVSQVFQAIALAGEKRSV